MIRPIKGTEPFLRECLESTYYQDYPRSYLTICFCISSADEPSLPLLQELISEYNEHDTRLYVENDDTYLFEDNGVNLGPNPKIRNMSRAYREAKGSIIWIVDCNIWISKGVAGRMVDALNGFGIRKRYKFVHLLPLAVAVDIDPAFTSRNANPESVLSGNGVQSFSRLSAAFTKFLRNSGGKLEEIFMLSSHAKFYTAINTVLVAPCIVGKSTMFRREHLDLLTLSASNSTKAMGIDYFSHNICEDHLIGDMLWKKKVPGEEHSKNKWGKHALVYGDIAIRPTAHMSIKDYITRRIRWLRVRKFTVTVATLVEPGTESFLCSLLGAYAFTKLPLQIIQSHEQAAFALFWVMSVACWAALDWTLYLLLRSGATIEVDEQTPDFLYRHNGNISCKDSTGMDNGKKLLGIHCKDKTSLPTSRSSQFGGWLLIWLCRELLAFPIWFLAVFCGSSVIWHGRTFQVGRDMIVRELDKKKAG